MKTLPGVILGGLLLAATCAGADNNTVKLVPETGADQAGAEQPALRIYKYTNSAGITSYSDQAPRGRRYEIMQFDCYACNPASKVDWHHTGLHLNAFRGTIDQAARKYGVDPALVRAVIHAESAFKPDARSKKGAIGLMQLMPATAKDMGVADPTSPAQNIYGGVRYLAWLLQKNNGNTLLATASYNAGPGAVERYNGIPPFEETETYVKRVRILHGRYREALASTDRRPQLSQIGGY